MKQYNSFNEMFNAQTNNNCFVKNEIKAIIGDVPLDFDSFYNGSWYTIIGAEDVSEWMTGYDAVLLDMGIGRPKGYVTFKGADMNKEYGLSGSVAYPDNLTFIAFPLDGLDIGKLAIFKIKMGDRWFDDIVDNNRWNMEEE